MPNPKTETTPPTFQCGWCGEDFADQTQCIIHESTCACGQEEMRKDFECNERRRMENQLWEEEHAAGRI